MEAVDILILSNGPGELATWVLPAVKALRQKLGDDRARVRISLVLSPCTHATGKEGKVARTYPEIDRVQEAEDFFKFLLWGKTAGNWDWRSRGVVIFLGGDQFFSVVLSKRLGYRTVTYAEWEARWYRWIDRFGVMKPEVAAKVPQKYASKLTVVGDLMAEVQGEGRESDAVNCQLIGLLPGSKANKLAQGVPLALAIAEQVRAVKPQTRFVIPVAPTLSLESLAQYADIQYNPVIQLVEGTTAELVFPTTGEQPYLKTASGLQVELWTEFPAYEVLCQCSLCVTTVGANTAELGSLGVPMIVLLPFNQLDAMRSWDGLLGLLANLPLVGSRLAKIINGIMCHYVLKKRFAWPNIWAKDDIVPELAGKLYPKDVAEVALDFLNHPEKLEEMRQSLRQVRGKAGAAPKLAQLVCEELGA